MGATEKKELVSQDVNLEAQAIVNVLSARLGQMEVEKAMLMVQVQQLSELNNNLTLQLSDKKGGK